MSPLGSSNRFERAAAPLAVPLLALGLVFSTGSAASASESELVRIGAERLAGKMERVRAQLAQTDLNSAQAAQFDRRISGLEAELRQLTGRLEDLEFRIRQQHQRLERFESETKARLLRLEQGQPSAPAAGFDGGAQPGPATTYTPPAGSGETVVGQAPQPQAAPAAPQTGTGQPGPLQPRTLGTVTDDDLAAVRTPSDQGQGPATVQPPVSAQERQGAGQAQQQAAVQLPQNDAQAAYDQAFDQLRQMNYLLAEAAFSEFLQLYPDNPLAGNAKYWLGETHYVRGDYETAAVIFAEGYQDFPESGKAPDNLLKLGMSLANLGANRDACATFGELQRRYPDAAPTVLQRAQRESSRLGC